MAMAAARQETDVFAPILSSNDSHAAGWPVRLLVSSQTEARHNRALWAPSHLISIRAPGTKLLSMIDLPPERHLELIFGDALDPDEPGAARGEQIAEALAFVDRLPGDARLLVHCLRGIGRAPALSLGVLARYLGPEDAAAALHALKPDAKPNRHVVALCDSALGLKGKLSKQALRFPAKVWKPAKA